jgi:hypothetical protein
MMKLGLASVALALVSASCGGTTASSSGSAQQITAATPGTFGLTVWVQVPSASGTAGAEYEVETAFTPAGACASTTVDGCYVTLCEATATGTRPDLGEVNITGAAIAAGKLTPQSDGVYAPISVYGKLPWDASGGPITFAWDNLAGDSSYGGSIAIPAPPYLALADGSALAGATTVSRTGDLQVSWSTDTPAAASDALSIDLSAGGTQVNCVFNAQAGNGTITSAALAKLPMGTGSYNVHSRSSTSQEIMDSSGHQWNLDFNLDVVARTSTGLANGTVTFE